MEPGSRPSSTALLNDDSRPKVSSGSHLLGHLPHETGIKVSPKSHELSSVLSFVLRRSSFLTSSSKHTFRDHFFLILHRCPLPIPPSEPLHLILHRAYLTLPIFHCVFQSISRRNLEFMRIFQRLHLAQANVKSPSSGNSQTINQEVDSHTHCHTEYITYINLKFSFKTKKHIFLHTPTSWINQSPLSLSRA